MSTTPLTVLETAGRITVETLEVLADILTSPWSAFTYCDKVGVPSIQAPTEWAPALTELRAKADAAKNPEQWAEITSLAAKIILGLVNALRKAGGPSPGPVESAVIKIVLPVLLEVTKRRAPVIHVILAAAFFTDQRLQDSFPQGLFAERWYAILGSLALKAGWGYQAGTADHPDVDVDWAPITSDALAAVTALAAIATRSESFKERLTRFWYGFDHPPIQGSEQAQALAQHAFTLLLNSGMDTIQATDFDKGIGPQPPASAPGQFGLTFVPIPKTVGGKSKLFVQVHGQANIEEYLGAGLNLKLTNVADFGLLASSDGLEPTGNASFQAEVGYQASPQPAANGTASAVEFRLARFSVGARASATELAAWLKLEQGEIAVSGGTWLDDFVPQLRFAFNVEAEASAQNGVHFKGGAGGDVLVPINQKIPILIGNAQIEAVHLQLFLGDDSGELTFSLQAAANLTFELLSILKVHVNGFGAMFAAGTAKKADGNVAGIAKMGWSPVIPAGAGVELNVWKITGGGAFFYDAINDRLSGAVKLLFSDVFSLTGLGIYQRASKNGIRSWIVVVSLELPQARSIFSIQGVGLIYASNRTTSPEAFLAGIATGDLDAVLFPDDPIGKAAQYLGALERLFPSKQDASVIGISAKFSGFAGMLTLDLGVLLDFQGSSLIRIYLVAQFVGLLRKPAAGETIDPLKQPFRILADGVAIWDTKTDELNIRIALRNSRIWAAELTGGASIFHGTPEIGGTHRGTYISIGGFHPDYVPPGTKIFVPPRLSLVLSKGDHLKLEFRSYLAFTPSSLQFGFSGGLEAHFYGFGIRGHLGLDVLIGFDGTFNVRLEFSVELLVGSQSLAAVRFTGSLVGYSPTVLSGKAEVKFLFWTLSVSGSITIHDAKLPDAQVDIVGVLSSSLTEAINWDNGGVPGVTLSDRKRDGVWLSPSAPLRLRQPVVPLNVPVERFGSVRLKTAQTFRIELVSAGTTRLATTPTMGEFALGMFLNLSQEEMLSSRGFENREAGVEITSTLETGAVANVGNAFEEIVIDPKLRPATTTPGLTFGAVSVFTAAAPAVVPLAIQRETFAVVDTKLVAQVKGRTFFEARSLVKPGSRIVPDSEVVA